MEEKFYDVLVMDDDVDIQQMIQSILTYYNYSVRTSSSLSVTNHLLRTTTPSMILMDMLLSGADGREICRLLKGQDDTKHIPIVMISAHPDAEVTCKAAGADDFLAKPFDIDDLLGKIRKHLTVAGG